MLGKLSDLLRDVLDGEERRLDGIDQGRDELLHAVVVDPVHVARREGLGHAVLLAVVLIHDFLDVVFLGVVLRAGEEQVLDEVSETDEVAGVVLGADADGQGWLAYICRSARRPTGVL